MKSLTIFGVTVFVALVAFLHAEGISSDQVRKRLHYDHDEEMSRGHVYLRDGKVVGLEPSPIPAIEKVDVPLPPRSTITRIYYGYAPSTHPRMQVGLVKWDLDSSEVTLFCEIIAGFSFQDRSGSQLHRVSEAGKIESEGIRVSRFLDHFCSMGFYLFTDDGHVVYIDGHPESENFAIDKPKYFPFRNPTINCWLKAKLKLKKEKEAATSDPTAISPSPASTIPAPLLDLSVRQSR